MQIDLQSISIKPLRQTFDHLAKRFGDKPATRYQEGTYDIQQTFLYHYRPTWEPELEIFDERRTAIRMRDWYDFKDPRQFYYGTYTIARAKQQEAADTAFDYAVDGGLIDELPAEAAALVLRVLVPMRHLEWGANMNNTYICAYSYGTAISAACMFDAMDRLGLAQHISRIGLAVGGVAALDEAKRIWLDDAAWQPLRRYVEDSFVVKDWFELFVAQNLALDSAVYAFVYEHVARQASRSGSQAFGLVTRFMKEWREETDRWVDAVTKVAVAESPENRALIRPWVDRYSARAAEAVGAVAASVFGVEATAVMDSIAADFQVRRQKIGV
jgi:phenol/toluene 2-monooxygenase (NADH) P1/A1